MTKMYQQGESINKDLVQLFNSKQIKEFTKEQQDEILNIICRIGAVAKFRCRSNSAYINFLNACFKNIATFQMKTINEKGHERIVGEMNEK